MALPGILPGVRGALAFAGVLLLACGARSSLDPDGGSPPALAGGANAIGGESSTGAGDQGGSYQGGSGGSGDEPDCVPIACGSDLVATLEQPEGSWLEVIKVAGDPCGNIDVLVRSASYVPSTGTEGTAVLRFDAEGTLQWQRGIPVAFVPGLPPVSAIAGTPSGGVVVATTFTEDVSLPGLSADNLGEEDVVLLRLDSQGSIVWARAFGTAASEQIGALAVTPEGDILVGGRSRGALDLGGGPLAEGAFVARLSSTGGHLWSLNFAEGGEGPAAFHVLPDGDFWVMGRAHKQAQFPGGSVFPSANQRARLFVARLHGDGSHVFSKVYANDSGDGYRIPLFDSNVAESLAVDDATGNVRFTVAMRGEVDFGEGPFQVGTLDWWEPGVVAIELEPDGDFVRAQELVEAVHGVTAAPTPDGVMVGSFQSLSTIAETGTIEVEPLATGTGEPELARIADGTIVGSSTTDPVEIEGAMFDDRMFIVRRCDQPSARAAGGSAGRARDAEAAPRHGLGSPAGDEGT